MQKHLNEKVQLWLKWCLVMTGEVPGDEQWACYHCEILKRELETVADFLNPYNFSTLQITLPNV